MVRSNAPAPGPSLRRAPALEVIIRRSALVTLVLLALPPATLTAAPLAGRWEGVFHGGRGDQPVTLILRPGASLTGAFYQAGDLVGPLDHGRVAGDSLYFTVMNF